MKTLQHYSLLLIILCSFIFSSTASAQFITIARKIKSMHSGSTDVATVILDAKTFKVYGAVIDTLTTNAKFKISQRDNTRRFVEFTTGTYKVSMQVDSLAVGLSQITVSSAHVDNSAKQTTDIAVDVILTVCRKLGVKCTLDKK
ncbi:MAG: hypothetical protein NTW31_12600 [Bacteroidetes bacterium]|nr:hypothetical protein [Bacteroidota bacterium]